MAVQLILFSALIVRSIAGPIPTVYPDKVGLDEKQLAKMDSFLHNTYVNPAKGQQLIAGWTSAVARDGKLAHFKVDGDQVLGKVPMSKDTIFRFYSMTKPVTAVTLMTFWEEGRFSLDDPVSDYIPGFKNMRVLKTPESPITDTVPCEHPCITIRHLLTHTSGLSYGFSPMNISVDMYYYTHNISIAPVLPPDLSLADWVDRLVKAPLVFQPGTKWHYSLSIDVCGRLVEVLSAKSFQATVHERILDPLGMIDSGFTVPQEKLSRLTPNYLPPTETLPLRDANDTTCVVPRVGGSGGGGLCGTTLDYLRFGLMLAGGGELEGVRILAPRTIRLIAANSIEGGKSIKALGGVKGDIWHGDRGLNGLSFKQWGGIGQGLGGQMVLDPYMSGMSTGKGSYYWGGAAGTLFRVDFEERIVKVFMMQRNDAGPPELSSRMEALLDSAIRDPPRAAEGTMII